MALTRDQLIELARANAKASLNPSVAYSFGGFKKLCIINFISQQLNK